MRWIIAIGVGAALATAGIASLVGRSHDDGAAAGAAPGDAVVTRTDLSPAITLRGAVVVPRARYLTRVPGPRGAWAEVEATGLLVRVPVPPEFVYRFAAPVTAVSVQLVGGPGPQPCAPLGWAGAAAPPIRAAGGVVVCRLAPRMRAVPGQPGSLEITLARRAGVLTLPLEAVAGTLQEGRVRRVSPGGRTVEQSVGLGQSDGIRIEITSGLREGDRVALPAPDLPGFTALGN